MKIIQDWSKVNFDNPLHRKKVFGALQAFMGAPIAVERLREKMKAHLQAFGSAGDFPTRMNEIIEKFHLTTMFDDAWKEIFNVRDFTGTNESGFDILDVEDGLTFRKVPIDGKAYIFKMAGAKTSVEFDMYGGGLGWHRTLIDDKKYWQLEDNAIAFRNKWYADKAAIYYALIDAISSTYNVTWQNPLPATLANTNDLYTANRDVQTINYAIGEIISDLKDKGYGVTPKSPFVILNPYQLTARLNMALRLLLQSFQGSAEQANYSVRLVPTSGLSDATKYYVGVPKIKAICGERMDLTIFNTFDEESYTNVAVGWGRHGGAIGDSEQFRRCATS